VVKKAPDGKSWTDEELVRAARDGRSDALEELVERHHGAVYRMVFGILGDADEASDATQETFMRAIRALSRFRGEARFKTWLLTIASNSARGMHRRRERRREKPLDDALAVPAAVRDGADAVAEAQEFERARTLLQRLPEKQRLAVQLRTQEGLSFKEVAEIIGSSEGAARVNYHHGIRRLRGMIE
jgi:RNA polymerase sigma-70 factor (ECF subfamily)